MNLLFSDSRTPHFLTPKKAKGLILILDFWYLRPFLDIPQSFRVKSNEHLPKKPQLCFPPKKKHFVFIRICYTTSSYSPFKAFSALPLCPGYPKLAHLRFFFLFFLFFLADILVHVEVILGLKR